MSKLVDSLIGHPTDIRIPLKERFTVDFNVTCPLQEFSTLREYSFDLRYRQVRIAPPGCYDEILRQEKRALNYIIYGQFKTKLIQLQEAIWNQDYNGARDLTQQLMVEAE